jgi:hypothetical protein
MCRRNIAKVAATTQVNTFFSNKQFVEAFMVFLVAHFCVLVLYFVTAACLELLDISYQAKHPVYIL